MDWQDLLDSVQGYAQAQADKNPTFGSWSQNLARVLGAGMLPEAKVAQSATKGEMPSAGDLVESVLNMSNLAPLKGGSAAIVFAKRGGLSKVAEQAAEYLQQAGRGPADILAATGLHQFPPGSGPWLGEIPTDKMALTPEALNVMEDAANLGTTQFTTIGRGVSGLDEMLSRYPVMEHQALGFRPNEVSSVARGNFMDPRGDHYEIGMQPAYGSPAPWDTAPLTDRVLSRMAHEFTHGTQGLEPALPGGTGMNSSLVKKAMARYFDPLNVPDPWEVYRAFPGEVMARNAQIRRLFDRQQLNANHPMLTMDLPADQVLWPERGFQRP